jgi:hypothetical protein
MPRHEVEAAYPDGYTCERHLVKAEGVEEACEMAVRQSGDADEAWTVAEAGGTFVTSVVELRRDPRIPQLFPDRFGADADARRQQEKLGMLIKALTSLFAETGEQGKPETRRLVLNALAAGEVQAARWSGSGLSIR